MKKLGFKPGYRASLVNAPRGFEKELKQLPDEVRLIRGRLPKHLDLVVIFAESQKTLSSECPRLARKLAQNGMLWIAWPKKSSGVVTDLSGNSVRQIGLEAGLVDVKVCAINETWSGLKFVYRLRDRESLSAPVR